MGSIKRLMGLALCGAALLHGGAWAQSLYVTDKVLVGIYEQASTEGLPVKVVPTGTPLEVLQREGDFAQVRTPDGITGWMENSYLIDHKPAQLVVLELALLLVLPLYAGAEL